MMSEPTAHGLRAVAVERLLRQAFEDGAKWVAQVDDPARSRFSMDRGFADFRESHCDAIIEIVTPTEPESKSTTNLIQRETAELGLNIDMTDVDRLRELADRAEQEIRDVGALRALIGGSAGRSAAPEDAQREATPLGTGIADDWRSAALRLGESLAPNGPDAYYRMTPMEWLNWALQTVTQREAATALLRERIEINTLVLSHQHDKEHADWYGRVYDYLQSLQPAPQEPPA